MKIFSLSVGGRFLLSDVKLQNVDSETEAASSVAVDISGFFESDIKSYRNYDGILRAGFNISNIGPKMKYSEQIMVLKVFTYKLTFW